MAMEQTYTLEVEPVAILRWPVSAEEIEEYATMMYGWDEAAAHDGVTLKVLHFQGYDVVVRVWSPQSGGHVDSPEDDVLSCFKTRSCDDMDQYQEEEVCCICLDALFRGSVTTLDCRHEFHPDCIRRWLVCGENFCPLCKAPAIK